MSSPVYPPNHNAGAGPSSSRSGYYRPATIAELAAQAQENLWDPSKGLKHWLRTAEKSRRNAEALVQEGNFEGAFVEYAKAATIVLEKLPTHREYQTLLNADQRHNLGMVSLRLCSLFPDRTIFSFLLCILCITSVRPTLPSVVPTMRKSRMVGRPGRSSLSLPHGQCKFKYVVPLGSSGYSAAWT